MSRIKINTLLLILLIITPEIHSEQKQIFDREKYEDTFAFGADIGWLTELESKKEVFKNKKGEEAELMTILQEEEGLNAVRFRVWVNPGNGWSGKEDVINLCKRAHEKGLKIMLDFHYSDSWADLYKQNIPAAWTDTSVYSLSKNVYDHTYDVLISLKKLGIVPKWVQIGNETNFGILWDVGKTDTEEGYKNFCEMFNAGYKAIKEVDENIITIMHLSHGHDNKLYRDVIDHMKKYEAKYDMIGMSCYPSASGYDLKDDEGVAQAVEGYMKNIKDLQVRYGLPIIVCEIGYYWDQPLQTNHFLVSFMKELIENDVKGCFYWEPESMYGYDLAAWDPDTHQATIAMDAFNGIWYTE